MNDNATIWLPDDDLTCEWLEAVEEYRRACDAADRRRIIGESKDEEKNTTSRKR